jgi:hypothetical protein
MVYEVMWLTFVLTQESSTPCLFQNKCADIIEWHCNDIIKLDAREA